MRLTLVALIVNVAFAEVPVSICDVLSRMNEFTGKRVSVRGRWLFSMETNLLSGEHCLAAQRNVGKGFAPGIDLSMNLKARDAQSEGRGLADIVQQMERKFGKHWKILEPPRDLEVWVTFVGELRVSQEPSSDQAAGFGHLNGLSAQLVVETGHGLSFVRRRR